MPSVLDDDVARHVEVPGREGDRLIGPMRRFVDMLVAGGWTKADDSAVKAFMDYKAPPKPTAPNLRDRQTT